MRQGGIGACRTTWEYIRIYQNMQGHVGIHKGMYVCLYVCMYVCMHVCTYVFPLGA